MDDGSAVADQMAARITQLESERDQLRNDIDQLCTQQGGSSYLLVATRMHFQRTAGLEQEIIKLQKELAECTRDRLNIKEELSDAHRIKIYLEERHSAEIAKKLKIFQGSIAAAIAERDNAFMEVQKAKENEELMSQKLIECQRRLEEVNLDPSKTRDLVSRLQTDVAIHKEENALFKKIVDKFYQIKKQSSFDCENEMSGYLEKCSNILDDPDEAWSFNPHREAATAENIGKSCLMSIGNITEQTFAPAVLSGQENPSWPDSNNVEDMHNIGKRNSASVEGAGTSNVFSQALQDKEERHFLERNENTAHLQRLGELERKLGEAETSLIQVTAEKLDALMKLEQLERMFLEEKPNHENRTEKVSTNDKDKTLATVVKDGTIKNLWKRASLKRLVGSGEYDVPKFGFQPNTERYFSFRKSSNNLDVARMKIEIASLNDSMKTLEQLTSQIYKLRQALAKAQQSFMQETRTGDDSGLMRSIDRIISEANLVHISLSSSLPLSWSAMADDASTSLRVSSERIGYEDSSRVINIESVSAAGVEMVQLLLFAAEILKDRAQFFKQD